MNDEAQDETKRNFHSLHPNAPTRRSTEWIEINFHFTELFNEFFIQEFNFVLGNISKLKM